MAVLLPNYLQTGSYAAKKDRRVNGAEVIQEGIVRKGHFTVAQRAAGANMSVDVSLGEAWVKGDSAVDQGMYHVVNDGTVNVAVSAANATNPRIDVAVIAVNDSTEVGGADSYLLEIIAGVPTAGATLANLKGAATPGATKLTLAYILVPAAATTVTTANIGGLRDPRAFQELWSLKKSEPFAIAGAPPQYAHGRPLDYIPGIILEFGSGNLANTGNILPIFTEAMENYDPDNMHEGSTGVITCKTPGLWSLAFGVKLSAGIAMRLGAWLNGVEKKASEVTTSGTSSALAINDVFRVGFGETIDGRVTNGGGAEKAFTYLNTTATWLGP